MSKPIDEVWRASRVNGFEPFVVLDNKPRVGVADRVNEWDRALLIAAAPDLARAVIGLLNAMPSATTHPAIQAAKVALKKAGVEI